MIELLAQTRVHTESHIDWTTSIIVSVVGTIILWAIIRFIERINK